MEMCLLCTFFLAPPGKLCLARQWRFDTASLTSPIVLLSTIQAELSRNQAAIFFLNPCVWALEADLTNVLNQNTDNKLQLCTYTCRCPRYRSVPRDDGGHRGCQNINIVC